MTLLFVVIVAGLAILTLWGFISPRGQWRVLAGWSRRESSANELGAGAVVVQRVVAGAGILVLGMAGWSMYSGHLAGLPKSSPPPGPIERMWGQPAPQLVNRVFIPLTAVPAGLVSQPVLGYQAVNGPTRDPGYLFFLEHYAVKDAKEGVGYLGHDPQPGLSALDTADLVLQVRGDSRCIPQQVVVEEEGDVVRVAVYYGQPNPSDGSNAARLADCAAKPSKAKATSVLVPVDLETALGDRKVVTLDGAKKLHPVTVVD